jgi:hypothetical protein
MSRRAAPCHSPARDKHHQVPEYCVESGITWLVRQAIWPLNDKVSPSGHEGLRENMQPDHLEFRSFD